MDNCNQIEQLCQDGQLDEAEHLIIKNLESDPDDADLHFVYGKIFYRRQQWGKAINQFQRVLELDPAYPGANEQIQMANSILGYFTPDMFNP